MYVISMSQIIITIDKHIETGAWHVKLITLLTILQGLVVFILTMPIFVLLHRDQLNFVQTMLFRLVGGIILMNIVDTLHAMCQFPINVLLAKILISYILLQVHVLELGIK